MKKSNDITPDVFTTYDLGVSAALLCSGCELSSIDKKEPKKALFIFRKKRKIEQIANSYFSDTLKVKARSYFDTLKALKNKLYADL
jgi:hypothetical protein